MEIIWGIIIGIIVLMVLVVAHELGHAFVARRYGAVVEEFGVGFPPRAFARKVKKSFLGKDVTFSYNWLPLGGFVKLQGEHDTAAGNGDYGSLTFWQKTQVLLAGVAVNWIIAVVLITVLAWVGLPKILPNQFSVSSDTQTVSSPVRLGPVAADMPGAKAGLASGDQIVRFAGKEITAPEQLTTLARDNSGKTVPVEYVRNGMTKTAQVTLRADNTDKKGYLGAGLSQQQLIRATWSAPVVGVGTTIQMTWVTLKGVAEILWNGLTGLVMKVIPNHTVQERANSQLATVGQSVAGPLSIFGILFPAAEQAGFVYVLMMAAIISLTLAVMNALPIPALDGGRWFVMAVYRLRKKALTKEAEEKIHGIGFMVLMGLMVLVTIADIGKFSQ
ncbi:MAG: M50 family metallopeptidase [Candidatus Saccharimonas sp.]